jgi:hypothetical protein
MFEERKYYYTPVYVDGNRELDYLRTSLPLMKLETATTHRITAGTENRPDMIAKIFYDNYDLGWLLHWHNGIVDPITEYSIGKVINIPYIDDYYQFFNRYSKAFD